MIESQIKVAENSVYSYIPRSPGDYELRVYRPGANSYVAVAFTAMEAGVIEIVHLK
jgi:hypothetical protein